MLAHVLCPKEPAPQSFEEARMTRIESLLAKVASNTKPRLLANGYVCWLVHAQTLPVSFFQSLTDIGGWSLASEATQSLWFFPGP